MSHSAKSDYFLLDSRIIKRNIRDGKISREEYQKYIDSLSDLEGECDDISGEIYGDEIVKADDAEENE